MAVQRMDHVGVVVDDLAAAVAFFVELGLEVQGDGPASVSGDWVDRVVGLDDVRVEIVFVATPDGHGRLELTKFHAPTAMRSQIDHAQHDRSPPSHFRHRRHRRRRHPAPCPRLRPRRRGSAIRGRVPALLRARA